MSHTDRVTRESNQGINAPIEPLEGRVLLSGGGHDGDGRFRLRAIQRDQAVADFNGDKKADIATLTNARFGKHFSAGAIVVQLGQGDGTFKASALKVTAGKATAIVAGDFNKDGKHDLAIAGVDKTGNTQVTVLFGDGAGKFTAQATQSVGTLPLANLTAGDLDGDGAADLVSFTDTKVYASLNDGTGKLAAALQQDNPLIPGVPAAIGDLDGDGRADLIGVSGDGIFLNRWFIAQKQFLQNVPLVLTSSFPSPARGSPSATSTATARTTCSRSATTPWASRCRRPSPARTRRSAPGSRRPPTASTPTGPWSATSTATARRTWSRPRISSGRLPAPGWC